MRCFYFSPPVGDVVDDIEHALDEADGNVAEAFRIQAQYYEKAATMCRRMAGIALETPGVDVIPDICRVWVEGPTERLETLAKDGLLGVRDFDDDEVTEQDAVPAGLQDILDALSQSDCADDLEALCADHD